jgi:predicted amidohydrolase YtcJ
MVPEDGEITLHLPRHVPFIAEYRFPNQKLTRAQALKGMTLDAAYASFAENDIGSLTPGKKADFVIFDRDIMTVPQDEILKAKVVATVVDGVVAYGAL